MKGKVALAVAGALALLGVAALLSRREDRRETFNQHGQETDPDLVPEDTFATTAVDKED